MNGKRNRIAEFRKRQGLSQEALADRLGTGRSTIVKLEHGTLRLKQDWMERLAKALHCKPYELLPDAPRVSSEEQELIDAYRRMAPGDRAVLRMLVDRMSDEKGNGHG